MLAWFALLVFAVVLVNGFTDAPNAVAGCISSRTMTLRRAVIFAGICNFLGSLAASVFFSGVAETVYLIVDFGDDPRLALSSLFAGMCAVVVWALIAFLFGIPTSESHALIFGMVGAALGGRMSVGSIRMSYLSVVFGGLVVSTVPAYFIAKWVYALMLHLFAPISGHITKYFKRAQVLGTASTAFLHGAQDSQKFLGVLMLGMSFYGGGKRIFASTIALSLACAAVMTAGTLMVGKRIIKRLGEDMVCLDSPAGVAADVASSVVLLLCTLLGIPVSTTHSKTCAMMGAGRLTKNGLDREVAAQMIWAWVLTFPCSAILGFFFSLLMKSAIS